MIKKRFSQSGLLSDGYPNVRPAAAGKVRRHVSTIRCGGVVVVDVDAERLVEHLRGGIGFKARLRARPLRCLSSGGDQKRHSPSLDGSRVWQIETVVGSQENPLPVVILRTTVHVSSS